MKIGCNLAGPSKEGYSPRRSTSVSPLMMMMNTAYIQDKGMGYCVVFVLLDSSVFHWLVDVQQIWILKIFQMSVLCYPYDNKFDSHN